MDPAARRVYKARPALRHVLTAHILVSFVSAVHIVVLQRSYEESRAELTARRSDFGRNIRVSRQRSFNTDAYDKKERARPRCTGNAIAACRGRKLSARAR